MTEKPKWLGIDTRMPCPYGPEDGEVYCEVVDIFGSDFFETQCSTSVGKCLMDRELLKLNFRGALLDWMPLLPCEWCRQGLWALHSTKIKLSDLAKRILQWAPSFDGPFVLDEYKHHPGITHWSQPEWKAWCVRRGGLTEHQLLTKIVAYDIPGEGPKVFIRRLPAATILLEHQGLNPEQQSKACTRALATSLRELFLKFFFRVAEEKIRWRAAYRWKGKRNRSDWLPKYYRMRALLHACRQAWEREHFLCGLHGYPDFSKLKKSYRRVQELPSEEWQDKEFGCLI